MTVINFPAQPPPPEEEPEEAKPTLAEFIADEVLDFIASVTDLPDMNEESFWLEVEDLRNRINRWSPDAVAP